MRKINLKILPCAKQVINVSSVKKLNESPTVTSVPSPWDGVDLWGMLSLGEAHAVNNMQSMEGLEHMRWVECVLGASAQSFI